MVFVHVKENKMTLAIPNIGSLNTLADFARLAKTCKDLSSRLPKLQEAFVLHGEIENIKQFMALLEQIPTETLATCPWKLVNALKPFAPEQFVLAATGLAKRYCVSKALHGNVAFFTEFSKDMTELNYLITGMHAAAIGTLKELTSELKALLKTLPAQQLKQYGQFIQ